MNMTFPYSAVIFFLAGLIITCTINAVGQAIENNQERDIFFDRDDYDAEHQEAKERLFNISLRICPNHTQEVQKKLEDFKECAEKIDEDKNTMCQVIQESLKTCMVPLFTLFEQCVPEKAKGLPTYVLRTANATCEYLCNINGAHLIELANPCILRKNHPYSRICIRKLRKEVYKYNHENLPEKAVICEFFKDFKTCFKTHLENACQDNVTREAFLGLYDKFLCKE